jgi:hypothetical protein
VCYLLVKPWLGANLLPSAALVVLLSRRLSPYLKLLQKRECEYLVWTNALAYYGLHLKKSFIAFLSCFSARHIEDIKKFQNEKITSRVDFIKLFCPLNFGKRPKNSLFGVGNSTIHFDLNYSVINEMKQNEYLARAKVRSWDTIHFLLEIFIYTLVDKWQLFGQKVPSFSGFFQNETKWNE